MIDDLATRASLSVAAFLFLAVGMSVLHASVGDAEEEAADDLARHLARAIDSVSRIDARATVRVATGSGTASLPPSLAGAPYRVEIRSQQVRVIVREMLAAHPLQVAIHPFAAEGNGYSSNELQERDAGAVIRIDAGSGFVIERAPWRVDGK